mmetsp:Transcript_27961/g.52926  ORF Transcript_27961/g.52926 Transcript_27961/m.52926 type:complete len:103 (-) Transcript_27961:182-490(-)
MKTSQGTNKFLKGAPLIAFMVVGSLGLSRFMQGHKDAIDAKSGPLDSRLPVDTRRKKKFSIENELEALNANLNEDYQLVKVPRPWEGAEEDNKPKKSWYRFW